MERTMNPKPPKLNKISALAMVAVAAGAAGYFAATGDWLVPRERVLELAMLALGVFGLHVRDLGLFRKALHAPPPGEILE